MHAVRRRLIAALALLSAIAAFSVPAHAGLVTLGSTPGAVTSFHDGALVWPASFEVTEFVSAVAGVVTLSVKRVEWGDLLSWHTTVSLTNQPALVLAGNAIRTFEIGAGESFATTILAQVSGSLGYGAYQLDVTFLPKMPQVPLPATAWLLLSGLCALFGVGRRRAAFIRA